MKYNNVVTLGHEIIDKYLTNDSICVDMTLGNGNDTLYLLSKAKFVYSFDIQEMGIINSKKLLNDNNIDDNKYKLILDDHQNVKKYILNDKIDIGIFNLGYLPKSDKTIKTNYISTINALNNLLELMNKNSMIILTVYKHEEGLLEYQEINNLLNTFDMKKYNIIKFEHINKPISPSIILIEIN